ncbi:S1 family peptidase [Psychromonas antarctica]|uniref:S1 family peptidase n=1 Tax=Psychromonas antarctica TaxID=67573 RepID=UPI001EE88499|nr:trypsin-like serine protease [Psychromonas antarctica]MCG6202662.1 trypsin-like serine protease [Psychromonas antarctica]
MFVRLTQYLTWLLFVFSFDVLAVVGGTTVADNDWPFLVSLHTKAPSPSGLTLNPHSCGGVYIGQGLIISAAHCAKSFVPAENSVACLGSSGSMVQNNCYSLKTNIIHPEYVGDGSSDIAIYQMDSIPEGYPRASIITEMENKNIRAGEMLQILGLGSTSYSSYIPAYELQGALIPIIDNESCNNLIGGEIPADLDNNLFICAGRELLGPAGGDSGTPAFIKGESGSKYVALVASGTNYTGIFTRIGFYLDWIKETTEELVGAIDYPRSVLWKVSDSSLAVIRSIRFYNQGTSNVNVDAISIDNEHFTLLDSNCAILPVGGYCEANVSVMLNDNKYISGQLTFAVAGEIKSISLRAIQMSNEPLVQGWNSIFQSWLSGGSHTWQDNIQSGLQSAFVNDPVQQLLEGEIEGPGFLSFSAKLLTKSGDGRLRIMVDEQQQYQFNGECDLEVLSVQIPEGSHKVTFEYQSSVQQSVNQEVNRTSLPLSGRV